MSHLIIVVLIVIMNGEGNPFENPLYHSRSEASSNESLPCQCAPQNHGFQWDQLDVKVDILEFKGRMQPKEFIDWLYSVDQVFDQLRIFSIYSHIGLILTLSNLH